MLNYSLNAFQSTILFEIYSKTAVIMLGFNTLAFIFMSYAIIFHGKTMGVYRWLLLQCFIFSYTLDIIISAQHIAIFFPVLMFYFDGISGEILSVKASVIMLLRCMCKNDIGFYFGCV